MEHTASIIIGVSSGIGGALATVAAMMLAFRSLEGKVNAVWEEITHVKTCLSSKIDKSACEACHDQFDKELVRGTRHFDDLFKDQRAITQAVNEMSTNMRLLIQRLDAFDKTMARITRIEVRLPSDPSN